MVDFGKIEPTSLMTAYVNSPSYNEQKTEKDVWHQDKMKSQLHAHKAKTT